MIDPERLKPFLLHPLWIVRQEVMSYFEDGWISDPEIVPLVFQALDRYGLENKAAGLMDMLVQSQRQPIDAATLRNLLARIERAEDKETRYWLSQIVEWAPLPVLRERLAELEQNPGVHVQSRAIVERRLKLAAWDQPELWEELLDFAAAADDEASYSTDLNQAEVDALIEALARFDEPGEEEICRLLEREGEKGSWLEIFLIDLAGARRIRRAVPQLVEYFHIETDYMQERETDALVRIGDPEAIRLIRKAYPQASWQFRNYASGVLGAMKLPESAAAILDMRGMRSIPEEFQLRLCYNLCNQFAPEAMQWGRQLLPAEDAAPPRERFDEFRRLLVALAEVRGLELAEKDEWVEEIRRQDEGAERRLAVHELDYPAGIIDEDEAEEEPDEDFTTIVPPVYEPPTPFRRTSPKIGPNQPCSCGSGKKYKKCCGKPR